LSADNLRLLFEKVTVAILVANDQGIYVDVNPAACALMGCTRDELIGRGLADFVDPERLPELTAQWKSFLRDGSQAGEFELRALDGKRRVVRFNATANFAPGLHCSFLVPALHQKTYVD
jgi:PAS domain S-box-containing protein